jgi:hypothetical protein
MSRVRYNYAKIRFGDQIRLRPMVDVLLLAPNGETIQMSALVDSGADFCLFPLDVAHVLGLDIQTLPSSSTAGVGSASNLTYFADLTINLENGVIFETRVGFTAGMNRAGFGLLGQQGFFENYNVEFRHRERVFTLEEAVSSGRR